MGPIDPDLRTLIDTWRARGHIRAVKPPGSKATIAELNVAFGVASETWLACADELEKALRSSRLEAGEAHAMFPIQDGPAIPWSLIAPHEAQARRNHNQTLKRLAERLGLSPCEAVAVLEDREWRPMPKAEALVRLKALVSAGEPPAPAEDGEGYGNARCRCGHLSSRHACDHDLSDDSCYDCDCEAFVTARGEAPVLPAQEDQD